MTEREESQIKPSIFFLHRSIVLAFPFDTDQHENNKFFVAC